MNIYKRFQNIGLAIFIPLVLTFQACSGSPSQVSAVESAGSPSDSSDAMPAGDEEKPDDEETAVSDGSSESAAEEGATGNAADDSAESATPSPVLYFDIGMHIEPFGATISPLVSGSTTPTRSSNGLDADHSYLNPDLFNLHVQYIEEAIGVIEKHGGQLTVQAQSPFTTKAIELGNTLLADLEARGHEIGFHFHEDAHLGQNANNLTADLWCGVIKEELGLIDQLGVKNPIRYWSGGNLYPHLLEAAVCAGFDVQSDWKNPQTQDSDMSIIGLNPWRPSGSPDGTDLSRFAVHSTNGKIIFLPEGKYSRIDFASMRKDMSDEDYFVFLKESLLDSLDNLDPTRVNVFHFTIHPGEFRGSDTAPFSVIDRFLTEVIDPQVQAGKIEWTMHSQMADIFNKWASENPDVPARTD